MSFPVVLLSSARESGVDLNLLKPIGVFQGNCYSDTKEISLKRAIAEMQVKAEQQNIDYLFNLRFKQVYQGHPSNNQFETDCQADGYHFVNEKEM